MLGHRLRGVTVVRRTVPMIDAYAGELNQVWTNLINNAVDAMCGSGTLQVTTRVENGEVVIEIGDTGPGVPPPKVAARAFEAFDTTKDVGQGTAWVLTLRAASSWSVMAARSASTPGRARPYCASSFRFVSRSRGDGDQRRSPRALARPTSPSLAPSTRHSVTAVALKQAHGSHNQDRGPNRRMLRLLTIDRHRPRPTFFVTPLLYMWGVRREGRASPKDLRMRRGFCASREPALTVWR